MPIKIISISSILIALNILSVACGTSNDSDASTVKASSYSCSYSINGENKVGKTKAECDRLKEENPFPSMGSSNFSKTYADIKCTSSINGRSQVGYSSQECSRLKSLASPQSSISPPAISSQQNSSCSYSRNGVTENGYSKAECERLAREFGL